MANPLILASGRQGLMRRTGRELRSANRQKEDNRILRRALAIFRLHLPEMLEEPPSATHFESKWSAIDTQLAAELKSETAYRRAHSFICNKLEEGNRQGVWNLTPPPAYITLRRPRPLRSESWHSRSRQMADVALEWRSRMARNDLTSDQLFAQLLVCGLLYGGLNRPALWPALAKALLAARPLQGNREHGWLTLQLDRDAASATNCYRRVEGLLERQGVCEVQYVPDPISMGLLRKFVRSRPDDWPAPDSIDKCLTLINKELGVAFSVTALCHGGISIAEHLPGVALPQVLLEYAIGRTPSASLPSPYWRRIITPALYPCAETQYDRFHSIALLHRSPGGNRTPFARGLRPFLLHQLKEVFHHDPARPVGKRDIINALSELKGLELTLCEQVLVQWLLTHLTERGNVISTAKIYLNTIGRDWLSVALLEPLDAYSGEEFCELYRSILNRPTSQKTREYKAGRLEDMHKFAVSHFNFEPLPEPIIETDSSIPHVSAAVVDEPLFAALLAQVDCFTDIDNQQRSALKCFLIMAYRTGLRPGEIAKLRLNDIEPSPIGWTCVRDNCHGHNKTDAALRKVPLFPLLTADEKCWLTAYIGERRLLAASRAELLFHAPGNPREPLDTKQLSLMVKTVLRDLSGGHYYRLYDLRHSALSRLQLLLHHDLTTLPTPVERAMLPYPATQRAEIVRLVAGEGRGRDRYMALAVFAGHSSPEISLSTYLHFTDLLLACHLASNQSSMSLADSQSLLGLSLTKSKTLIKDATITPARLRAYLLGRLGEFQAVITGPPRTSKPLTANPPARSSQFVQSGAVLSRMQAGHDYRDIAWFYGLSNNQVQRWHTSALQLRELITRKVTPSLFPKSRAHLLLPAEPNNIEEKRDVATALNACQKMWGNKAQLSELKWAIRYCLINSNSSRAGIRFNSPLLLFRFMDVVSQLIPLQRWHLQLRNPKGKKCDDWQYHAKLEITRQTLRKGNQYPDGLGTLYLRHAKEHEHIARGLEQYSSHSLLYLFHRLAIVLFTANEIRRWQLTPLLSRAWKLVDTHPLTKTQLNELNDLQKSATYYEVCQFFWLLDEVKEKMDPDAYNDYELELFEEHYLRGDPISHSEV